MNLDELMAAGGFVPAEPLKKQIVWKKVEADGTETVFDFAIFVKKHSFGSIEKIWGLSDDRSRTAFFISQSVRLGESGEQEVTYEKALQLAPDLAALFVNAINEVNKTGKVEPKN